MLRTAAMALLALALATTPACAQQVRPWIVAEIHAWSDDQPRQAVQAHTQYGRYLSPAATMALNITAQHTRGNGSVQPRQTPRATAVETSTVLPALGATLSLPSLRTGLAATAGALLGAADGAPAVVWRAEAGLGLGAGMTLRARGERARHDWTLGSIDTLVVVRSVELAVDRSSAPGWAAEALVRRSDYGDDNPVSTAYGWILAPLSRAAGHSLRGGYSVSWQDSEQSTWVAAPGRSRLAPAGPLRGRYHPYHSPHDLLTHSVLAEAALAVGAAWYKVDGAVGVRATETVPSLNGNGGEEPVLHFAERRFTPYRGGVSWTSAVDEQTSLTAAGAFSRTAYYRVGSLRLALARSL